MNYSIYNTYLSVSPRIGCVYNALTDKTVVFYGDVKKLGCVEKLPVNLKNIFIENGMIVDDDKDEFSQYVDWAKKVESDKTSFHLLINPTLNCNFHCSYCYESHFKSKMDNETLSRVKSLIMRQFNEGRNLTISFFGGEPLLYYDDIMKPLIEFSIEKSLLHGQPFSCNMTSNGYLLNKERVGWLRDHSFTNAQITLDGPKEVHNKVRYRFAGDNTYDRIVENIKLLVKNGVSVTLRLNCTGSNVGSLNHISDSFDDLTKSEKELLMVDMHVVWQEEDKGSIITRMDKTIDSFRDKGIPASKMDFRGFCYADRRNSCLVNFNGDVYKCTARDFTKTPRDGYLNESGIIIWENNSLEKRMQSKFKNPHCRECRIFPLCHGGCSTNSLENNDYCMHNFDDEEKDNVVRDRIVHNSKFNTYV